MKRVSHPAAPVLRVTRRLPGAVPPGKPGLPPDTGPTPDPSAGRRPLKTASLSLGLFAAFASLSAADFLLTASVLRPCDSILGEGNLVPGWVLGRFGWTGLAIFKAATLALVAGLCLVIAWKRPVVVPYLLGLACLITGAVVVYSLGLKRGSQSLQGDSWLPEIVARREQLERMQERSEKYLNAVRAAAKDLREGRITLAEGVAALNLTEQAHDPNWPLHLRLQFRPLQELEELLAASLTQCALAGMPEQAGEPEKRALGDRLAKDFRTFYGKDLPDLPELRTVSIPPPVVGKPVPMAAPAVHPSVDEIPAWMPSGEARKACLDRTAIHGRQPLDGLPAWCRKSLQQTLGGRPGHMKQRISRAVSSPDGRVMTQHQRRPSAPAPGKGSPCTTGSATRPA